MKSSRNYKCWQNNSQLEQYLTGQWKHWLRQASVYELWLECMGGGPLNEGPKSQHPRTGSLNLSTYFPAYDINTSDIFTNLNTHKQNATYLHV